MKKIGKLKLNELSLEEQKLLKGGGAVWDPSSHSYLLPEVVVTNSTTKPPFDAGKDTPALQDPDFRDWALDNPVLGTLETYIFMGVAYAYYLLQ